MTTTVLPIDPKQGLNHGFRRFDNYSFAQHQPAVAIQITEVAALVATLPLAFAKLTDGQFLLVAVTGFANGRNLLIDEQGRWGGLYIPSQYRGHPFSLRFAQSETSEQRKTVLCFDHSSGLYRETPDASQNEERFFNDDGTPTPFIKQLMTFLAQTTLQQQATQNAVNALAQAQLLTPWQLKTEETPSTSQLPQGLYRIDETALNQVDSGTLESLHKTRALGLAYGQILSMGRLVVLQRLLQRIQAKTSGPSPVDPGLIQKLFDNAESETLKFNW